MVGGRRTPLDRAIFPARMRYQNSPCRGTSIRATASRADQQRLSRSCPTICARTVLDFLEIGAPKPNRTTTAGYDKTAPQSWLTPEFAACEPPTLLPPIGCWKRMPLWRLMGATIAHGREDTGSFRRFPISLPMSTFAGRAECRGVFLLLWPWS